MRLLLLLLAALTLPLTATAQTEITLEAAKDNTLYEDDQGQLSNGAGNYLFSGRTSRGERRRALVWFDVAGAVPAGATIEAVSVSLTMNRSIAGSEEVTLHRLTSDWGEGTSVANGQQGSGGQATADDATWLHTFYDTQT